jgi:hypothetical protein
MICLGICQPTPTPEMQREITRLGHSAVWYPDLPSLTLCLNEDAFLPRNHYVDAYKPLFWTSFGGPGGIFLQHLTKISVICRGGIRRIEFFYNTEIPSKFCVLGKLNPDEYAKKIDFVIDGPGGEIISVVEVSQHYDSSSGDWLAKEGALVSCKASYSQISHDTIL